MSATACPRSAGATLAAPAGGMRAGRHACVAPHVLGLAPSCAPSTRGQPHLALVGAELVVLALPHAPRCLAVLLAPAGARACTAAEEEAPPPRAGSSERAGVCRWGALRCSGSCVLQAVGSCEIAMMRLMQLLSAHTRPIGRGDKATNAREAPFQRAAAHLSSVLSAGAPPAAPWLLLARWGWYSSSLDRSPSSMASPPADRVSERLRALFMAVCWSFCGAIAALPCACTWRLCCCLYDDCIHVLSAARRQCGACVVGIGARRERRPCTGPLRAKHVTLPPPARIDSLCCATAPPHLQNAQTAVVKLWPVQHPAPPASTPTFVCAVDRPTDAEARDLSDGRLGSSWAPWPSTACSTRPQDVRTVEWIRG